MSVTTEMPKYQSHKKVWALKIKSIKRDGEGENRETDGSAIISPEEDGYAPFKVDSEYMYKHKPEVGGYFVVYEDGYKSFSPAKAFQEGYSKVKGHIIKQNVKIHPNDLDQKRLEEHSKDLCMRLVNSMTHEQLSHIFKIFQNGGFFDEEQTKPFVKLTAMVEI